MRMADHDEVLRMADRKRPEAVDGIDNEELLDRDIYEEPEKDGDRPLDVLIEFSPDGRLTLLSEKNNDQFSVTWTVFELIRIKGGSHWCHPRPPLVLQGSSWRLRPSSS